MPKVVVLCARNVPVGVFLIPSSLMNHPDRFAGGLAVEHKRKMVAAWELLNPGKTVPVGSEFEIEVGYVKTYILDTTEPS